MPLRGTGPFDRCRNETSAGYVSQKTPMLFSAPSYGGFEDGTLCVLVMKRDPEPRQILIQVESLILAQNERWRQA